ncbi:MAG: hypothetical protein U7123_17390 [Potamolinea sp.]
MALSQTNLHLLWENCIFLVLSTFFLVFVGWVWSTSKPFTVPKPLPSWFKAWLFFVLVVGVALPLVALILWGVWWGKTSVVLALVPYFLMLGFQILSESVTLNQFHSCVWVIIPCLYLPYRIWQLYTGLTLLSSESELILIQNLLRLEIGLWIFNYGVHLSQLPRLLRWDVETTIE